jgi:hypothetical protein
MTQTWEEAWAEFSRPLPNPNDQVAKLAFKAGWRYHEIACLREAEQNLSNAEELLRRIADGCSEKHTPQQHAQAYFADLAVLQALKSKEG